MRKLAALWLLPAVLFTACTKKKEVWIYTSLYKEVIAEMEPLLQSAIPDAQVKWFQGGSENVAAKLNTELAAGRPKADVVVISDPFWYVELKQSGKLLPYPAEAAKEVPSQYADPEKAYVANRMPVVVIGYNSEVYKPNELPQRWKDLADPKWKGRVSMGSPLESGTMFTAVALLSRTYGWDFFQKLRANDVISAGGNNSVITRIETKERSIGIVLLENILKAQSKGSPVRAIYPLDGAIPVPSPIAILKDSTHPELAKRVYDWFFTPVAQNAIVKSGMYSPLEKIVSPENARPWGELKSQLMPWTPELVQDVFRDRDTIKKKFSELVIH